MGIFNNFMQRLYGKKLVNVNLDAESVRNHNIINALSKESAELKGTIAKLEVDLGKRREKEQDVNEDEEVRLELNRKKQELERKNYPKYFSLTSFFNKLRNNKFREKVGFYSFDRGKKLAKFGDLGISSDGDFILLDDRGVVLMKMKRLQDIFQSVSGLGNDVIDGKIPLNVDGEGNYIENIMMTQTPELTPTIDGKFQYSVARKRPLYEYLNELRDENSDLYSKVEGLELTNTELGKKVQELKVSQRVAEDISDTSKSELSEMEKTGSAMNRIFRKTTRELSQSRDYLAILEEDLEKVENQLIKMRSEAEREGNKLNFEKAIETILNIRQTLNKDEPQEVRIIQDNPQKMPEKVLK